jgi:hypothetical protein
MRGRESNKVACRKRSLPAVAGKDQRFQKLANALR